MKLHYWTFFFLNDCVEIVSVRVALLVDIEISRFKFVLSVNQIFVGSYYIS